MACVERPPIPQREGAGGVWRWVFGPRQEGWSLHTSSLGSGPGGVSQLDLAAQRACAAPGETLTETRANADTC